MKIEEIKIELDSPVFYSGELLSGIYNISFKLVFINNYYFLKDVLK